MDNPHSGPPNSSSSPLYASSLTPAALDYASELTPYASESFPHTHRTSNSRTHRNRNRNRNAGTAMSPSQAHPTLTPYRALVILFIALVGAEIYTTRTVPFDAYGYDARVVVTIGWVAAVLCLNSLFILGLFESRECYTRLAVHESDCIDWLRRRMHRRTTHDSTPPSKFAPDSNNNDDNDDDEQSALLPAYTHDGVEEDAHAGDAPKQGHARDISTLGMEQFVLQDPEWEETDAPKITVFRLFVTILVLCVGVYKACVYAASDNRATGSADTGGAGAGAGAGAGGGGGGNAGAGFPRNSWFGLGFEAECATATMGAIGLYWLSLYDTTPCYAYPRIFHLDHRKTMHRGLKHARTHAGVILCMLGSTLGVVFALGCIYLIIRIPGMDWVDTPAPSKGLYAAATKPLAMLFAAAMAFGGLFGAHSLAEEGLRMLHPRGGVTPYSVFSAAVNRVVGTETRQWVGTWVVARWTGIREWVIREVLSERTPVRRAVTRQLRGLPYTMLIFGLYILATLMFAWLGSMGVALIKTLEGGEHWIALVLIWGCALIEMGIALCMLCVIGVWFKGFVGGLVREFRKDLEEGCEDAE